MQAIAVSLLYDRKKNKFLYLYVSPYLFVALKLLYKKINEITKLRIDRDTTKVVSA